MTAIPFFSATFKVEYDHRQDEVVDIISESLEPFGLKIVWVEGGDGFDTYQIISI